MYSTDEGRDRRIRSWLEDVELGTQLGPDLDYVAPPAKRRRPDEIHESTTVAQFAGPHTPPLTHAISIGEAASLGPDDAPRAAFNRFRPPTPRKRPAYAPRRTRAVLDRLDKPVHVHALPAFLADILATLPSDIIPLYRQILSAAERHMIIPHEVREEVAQVAEERPWYFRQPDPVTGPRAKQIFDTLCSIRDDAVISQRYQRGESAWNNLVHSPLLRLVFARDPDIVEATKKASVRYEPVMAANIQGDSIPLLAAGPDGTGLRPACSVSLDSQMRSSDDGSQAYSESNVSLSRLRSSGAKVDYVLVLDSPKDTSLSKTISELINRYPVPHVNQTTYLAVKDSPIAVAIETKTETAQDDPLVQLGIWTAAWYQHMYDLREMLVGAGPKPRLVSVPIVQVVGHAWQVYFARDAGTSIDVYGPVALGSTDTIISLYALLSSLEAIKAWIEDVFRVGMETWFSPVHT